MRLHGNYDLDIIEECNLHCAGCTSLDYLGYGTRGDVTVSSLAPWELTNLINKIKQHVTSIDCVNLVGGEPTLHPQFAEIIDILRSADLFDSINVVTNGTNFTPSVCDVLKGVDMVYISDYVNAGDGETISKTITELPFRHTIWPRENFETVGVCDPVDPQENWKSCYMKDFCRVLTVDGLARCRVCSNERIHIASWDDGAALFQTIDRKEAYDRCGTCGTPKSGETYEWHSLKPEIDRKNYKRGIELIRAVNI